MIDDPVVLILREAAARGRQLRLARECVAQSDLQLSNDAIKTPMSDAATGSAASPQRDNDADAEV